MPKNYRIIGNSRSEMTDDEFRSFARDAARSHGRAPVDDGGWEPFAEKMTYVGHEFDPDNAEPVAQAVAKAESALGGEPRRLFYLAVPPPVPAPAVARRRTHCRRSPVQKLTRRWT